MTDSLEILLNLTFLALIYLLLWPVLRAGRRELFHPQSGTGNAVLRALNGDGVYPIDDHLVIGRDSECSLVLEDSFASGRHAAIEWDGRGWILRDLGSTNGTLLDGHPVSEARLRGGDVIQIGNTRLRFETRPE